MKTQSKATPRASVPNSKNIATRTLANGARVFVYENFASPSVVISGHLNAGARDETTGKHGLSGFVSDCLMRGTSKHSYRALFDTTESIGANLSIGGSMHTTSMFAKSLTEDAALMLDLIAECVREPLFPSDEVEKERAEWINELEESTNSTNAMCGKKFSELCYPSNHPYHHPGNGTLEIAKAITLNEVRDFHKRYYAPAGMCLVIVGAIKAENAFKLAEAALGDWATTRPERAPLPTAPKAQGAKHAHVAMPGKSQTTLLWGQPALPRTHPDWLACALMNSILGQFGMYGRLGESVRKEEGLVYYVGSRFEGGPGPGSWNCSAGTNPNTVDRVVELCRKEVRRIQTRKVKPQELDDNKRYFVGCMPLALETNEGIAGQIQNMARYQLGLDYLLEYPEHVAAVTADEIMQVAQSWLDADNYVLASAGP